MPAAIAIPAAISAGGSFFGGIMQSRAAGKAANIQAQNAAEVARMAQEAAAKAGAGVNAAREGAVRDVTGATDRTNALISDTTGNANQTLLDIFNQQQGNLNPYLQAGQQGVTTLMEGLAPGGALSEKFRAPTAEEAAATPGFQFQLNEAMKALNRSAAARGGLQSGGTLKALTQYGQNVASTYYQNAFNNSLNAFQTNRNNTMQGLTTLAGLGQFGTSQYNTAASNYGNQAAGNLMTSGLQQGTNLLNAGYYSGNTGIRAAEYGGDANMNAARIAGGALTGGANAQAAGAVAQGNAYNSIIGGLTNAAQYAVQQHYGGTPAPNYQTPNNNFANWYNVQPPQIQQYSPPSAWSLPGIQLPGPPPA